MGVSTIPTAERRTSPLNIAYAEAKTFDAEFAIGSTGPMPARIIDALRSASTQRSPAMKWYPSMPAESAVAAIADARRTERVIRLRNRGHGRSFSPIRSYIGIWVGRACRGLGDG
jgi:hypothetical protein